MNDALEFHLDLGGIKSSHSHIYSTFQEAASAAIQNSLTYAKDIIIDVVCWTRQAAVDWQGEAGGEEYDRDPNASVFERIVIKACSQGSVP